MKEKIPKIALIGKVNVGKSSLFNRIIEEEKALVSKIPGTTRDRNYAECEWQGKRFILIDLAGFQNEKKEDILEKEIQKQIKRALDEADLILFIVDVQTELTKTDYEISKLIKKIGKPTIFVANKADNPILREQALTKKEYWQLGFGQIWPVSAVNGSGVGDLLDEIVKYLKNYKEIKKTKEEPVKVAIIGRVNVGKSSLLNALLNEERVIVSPIPHTTREPQDTLIYHQKKPILLIDTAGIRKKSKIASEIEKLGVEKTIKVIKKSDILLLVLDLTLKISHQDKALVDLVNKNKKGLILVVNKIDLEKDFPKKFNKFIEYYQWNLPNASFAPLIFVSALTKQNVEKLFDLIWKVKENRERKLKKKELLSFFKNLIKKKNFDQSVWSKIRIKQVKIKPPTFVLEIPKILSLKKLFHQAQINIVEKELRKKFHFEGTQIDFIISLK